MRHTLLKRLKPEFLIELNSNIDEGYEDMVNKIKKWLSNTVTFESLTIHQVHCLSSFTGTSITKVNQIELMYGSHWFFTDDEYEKFLKIIKDKQ